jgi:hypothetical protein
MNMTFYREGVNIQNLLTEFMRETTILGWQCKNIGQSPKT